MPYLQLLRLAGETLPDITTSNALFEYFHKPITTSLDIGGGATAASYTLGLSQWFYGSGASATGFKTGMPGYSMNINGVLQQSSLYSVSSDKVKLIAPANKSIHIPKNAPITLQTYKATTIVSTTRTFAIT